MNSQQMAAMKPENVLSPSDHGILYAQPDYIYNVTWLWNGNKIGQIEEVHRNEPSVIFVDLSEKDSPVKVVRALSKDLVPINFGFGNDYFTHPTILNLNPGSQKLPHYFA